MVDRDGWAELGDAGRLRLCLAEEAGGVGLGLAEAAVVFEELGRALGARAPRGLAIWPPAWWTAPATARWWSAWCERPRAGGCPALVAHLADLDVLLVVDDGARLVDAGRS